MSRLPRLDLSTTSPEPEPVPPADAMARLADALTRLIDHLERSETGRRVEPLCYGIDELAYALGVSKSTIEHQRPKGLIPPPDLVIGSRPLWYVKKIRAWIERGGQV